MFNSIDIKNFFDIIFIRELIFAYNIKGQNFMQYKKDEIKQKILNAAIIEFEKNGFNNALIKNIADESKVPVGNIYRYFNSKSELFDTIVENAYQNLPDIILKLYEKEKAENFKVKDIAKNIATSIMDIYNMYSKQLLILVFKSGGTKYSNFMSVLYGQITQLLQKELFGKETKQNLIISKIITKGFVDGLFDILKNGEEDTVKVLTERLILFYFYNIEERT